jgi:hypothetical protein
MIPRQTGRLTISHKINSSFLELVEGRQLQQGHQTAGVMQLIYAEGVSEAVESCLDVAVCGEESGEGTSAVEILEAATEQRL